MKKGQSVHFSTATHEERHGYVIAEMGNQVQIAHKIGMSIVPIEQVRTPNFTDDLSQMFDPIFKAKR